MSKSTCARTCLSLWPEAPAPPAQIWSPRGSWQEVAGSIAFPGVTHATPPASRGVCLLPRGLPARQTVRLAGGGVGGPAPQVSGRTKPTGFREWVALRRRRMDHGGWFISKPRGALLAPIKRLCLRLAARSSLAGGECVPEGWNVEYLGFYGNNRTTSFKSWKLENEHSRNGGAALQTWHRSGYNVFSVIPPLKLSWRLPCWSHVLWLLLLRLHVRARAEDVLSAFPGASWAPHPCSSFAVGLGSLCSQAGRGRGRHLTGHWADTHRACVTCHVTPARLCALGPLWYFLLFFRENVGLLWSGGSDVDEMPSVQSSLTVPSRHLTI